MTHEMPDESPAWLPERLERARRAALNELFEGLGFADADALRAHLDTQAQDLERLQTERDTARETVFALSAAAHDFIDPDEARALLDWDALDWDAGLGEPLAALAAQRPHLLRRPQPPALDAPPLHDHGPRSARDLPDAQRDALRRRFKLR